MTDNKQSKPVQVEVTLIKRHIHAGVAYAPGQKIKVSEPDRAWLADHKIINDAPKAQEGAK